MSIEPRFDPDHNSDNMQRLLERMARAKWLAGKQKVTSTDSMFNFSPLGEQRINKVINALIKAAPGFFTAEDLSSLTAGSITQPSPLELALMILAIQPVFAELLPPDFSAGERDSLISLLCLYARRKGTSQNPPTSPPRF